MIESIPVANEGYTVRRLKEETLIISASGEELMVLEDIETFIWERVDGERTVGKLIDAVCEAYEVERNIAQADLEEFLSDLASHGVIQLKTGD